MDPVDLPGSAGPAARFDAWDAVRDEAWFELLVESELPAIKAYAARRVRDPDDIVSEVFATAWRHLETLPVPPRAWLIKVASNHIRHADRSQRRYEALADRVAACLPAHDADHVDATVERLDAARFTSGAIGLLAEADAEVLRLAIWDELSPPELAEVLGCSRVAARVRLHRARRRLGALLTRSDADGASTNEPTEQPYRNRIRT